MARHRLSPRAVRRIIAFSAWLYILFLRAYPEPFRRDFGSRMVQVFRDSCHDTLRRHGLAAIIPIWLHTLSDLINNACLERWQQLQEGSHAMINAQHFPRRLWIALATTVIAFAVSLVASLNLYLIEDASPLTQAAYSASTLLRVSYDGIYVSALASGVVMCAIAGYALLQRTMPVMIGLTLVGFVVVMGGFGGLIVRHPTSFLLLFATFMVLTLISLLVGRGAAARMEPALGHRAAMMLGACVSVGSLLLVNVAAQIVHMLLLNPVSHPLYM
ncbi:hypothetical protein [Dictyobacter aurantiacus]|uniref:Uncharacterized protein n=1 Tax=Dictyobacter aurantiacus TaxID=1936993 RepID=A0A401ZGS4_9CHLR|nr:hypothetical protein [Dictyobacter aurantiacus]GCE06091.1 hypothetical protein KDAU_34200 [Dictyobacter aurantiacus]